MGVCRRAALYLARKKGKSMLLFLIFFLASALLLICFSILDGTGQAARNLRSNIGAAFYIRPYAQMTLVDGALSEGTTPVISQQSIAEVIDASQGQIKAFNTEHYGYAKSDQLHFLPGAGDSEASNMGRVTAVRDSGLTDVFLNEEYTLLAGRHIQPEDENKILISAELAAENSLEIGDVLTLTHAGLGQRDGEYIDTIPEKTAFAQVEIVGIFQYSGATGSADTPTAGKAANHMYSDSHLLVHLQEQQEGIYAGEIAFYIADPLELDALLERVASIDSIDWENHILRKNDLQYEQIAGQLQNLQNLAAALIAIVSALSIAILVLILMMRIRDLPIGGQAQNGNHWPVCLRSMCTSVRWLSAGFSILVAGFRCGKWASVGRADPGNSAGKWRRSKCFAAGSPSFQRIVRRGIGGRSAGCAGSQRPNSPIQAKRNFIQNALRRRLT